jgi:hypothetical protein
MANGLGHFFGVKNMDDEIITSELLTIWGNRNYGFVIQRLSDAPPHYTALFATALEEQIERNRLANLLTDHYMARHPELHC